MITNALVWMVFIASVGLGARAAWRLIALKPRCPAGPTGFLISGEEGNVVSECGVHIGPVIAEPNVACKVIRRIDDTTAKLLGRLVTGAGERALKLGCQWLLR
ncbi:hypothetical protein ACH4GK_09550 [Streptomyces rimosus]|uniref:hypothetical protein n=1 Tax=Streptomyces rimosus TaxID=1927 RepID=UPI0004C758F7|nr:hypothetical protein [Streptomyces rimosus]